MANRWLVKGVNDLASQRPDIAEQIVGTDPTTITVSSSRSVDWKCKLGHVWSAPPASRTVMKSGCPYCSGQYVWPGFNDLATTHPDLAKELHDIDPTTISKGSGKKVSWDCHNGHVFHATVSSRTRGDGKAQGCGVCYGNEIVTGLNDMLTLYPEVAFQADVWDPSVISAGSHKYFKWRCGKGHVWVATAKSRCSLGRGCPTCAVSGFDPNRPAYLYLLRHDAWGLLQIGITNKPSKRLQEHMHYGWEFVDMIGPQNGEKTRDQERSILKSLKSFGAQVGNKGIAGNFSGYTESWIYESYPVSSLKELISLGEIDD